MTVSSENTRDQYNGNGVTLLFPVTFYFLLTRDLRVVLYNSVTKVETELTETTHYEVTGAGNPVGGTVTMLDVPTSDETLTILRDVYAVQKTDYLEHTAFPAESHERALDRLTMLHQQINEKFVRTVRFKSSSTHQDVRIENLEAGKVIIANATADGLEMGLMGAGSEGNVSTSGTPVANDFAKFVSENTIEGRSYAETRTDLGLDSVGAASNTYYVDASEADQGVTGGGGTIKAYIDTLGSEKGTLVFINALGNTTTTYTLTTTETIPANISLKFDRGAIIDGVGVLYVAAPEQIIASPKQQIFGTSVTLNFQDAGTVYPEWWTRNMVPGSTDMTSAIQKAVDSVASNSIVYFPPGDYLIIGNITASDKVIAIRGNSSADVRITQCTSGGFVFTATVDDDIFMDKMTFKGVSLIAGASGTGTAITWTYTGGIGKRALGTMMNDVQILPSATAGHYWTNGVRGTNVKDALFNNVTIASRAVSGETVRGFLFDGDSSPVELWFDRCYVYAVQFGIYIEGTYEGIYITNSCIWITARAIHYAPASPQGVCQINGCYLQSRNQCIYLDLVSYFQITNNSFEILDYLGAGAGIGVKITNSSGAQVNLGTINNNHFNGHASTMGDTNTGISADSVLKTRIHQNSFYNFDYGISVHAGAENELYSNVYHEVTTPIFASAASRIVGDDHPEVLFSIEGDATQSISPSAETVVNFNSETADFDSYFDLGANRWTPPKGWYRVNAGIELTSYVAAGDIVTLGIRKNAFKIRAVRRVASASGQISLAGSWIVNSNGTDYFDVYVICGGTGSNRVKTSDGTLNNFQGEAIR